MDGKSLLNYIKAMQLILNITKMDEYIPNTPKKKLGSQKKIRTASLFQVVRWLVTPILVVS